MKTIKVTKRFILTLANGVKHVFDVGTHEVEAAIADHWFVAAHSEVVKVEAEVKAVVTKVETEAKTLITDVGTVVEADLKSILAEAGNKLKALEPKASKKAK